MTSAIFLSYSSNESDESVQIVYKIKECLSWLMLFQVGIKHEDQTLASDDVDLYHLLIAFFSENFQADNSCRRDVELFTETKKPVLFVKIQQGNFDYAEWLKPLVAVNIYVNFHESQQPGLDVLKHVCKHLKVSLNKDIEEKAQQSSRRHFPRFQFFNVPTPAQYIERQSAEDDILTKLTFLTPASVLLVSGVEGVGKTTVLAKVIRTKCDYLKDICKIHVVLWLNCSNMDQGATARQLIETAKQAAPDASFLSVEKALDYFTAREQFGRVLLVLDDVKTCGDLESIRSRCPNNQSCTIVFTVVSRSESPISKSPPASSVNYRLTELALGECETMFSVAYGLNAMNKEQLKTLATLANGLPKRVVEIAAHFRKCRSKRDFDAVYGSLIEDD